MHNVTVITASTTTTAVSTADELLQQNLRIASQARELARNLLHPSCVTKFWILMVQEYGKRLNYRVEVPAAGMKKLIDEIQISVRNYGNKIVSNHNKIA